MNIDPSRVPEYPYTSRMVTAALAVPGAVARRDWWDLLDLCGACLDAPDEMPAGYTIATPSGGYTPTTTR